jgi:hypothetical protein
MVIAVLEVLTKADFFDVTMKRPMVIPMNIMI